MHHHKFRILQVMLVAVGTVMPRAILELVVLVLSVPAVVAGPQLSMLLELQELVV